MGYPTANDLLKQPYVFKYSQDLQFDINLKLYEGSNP